MAGHEERDNRGGAAVADRLARLEAEVAELRRSGSRWKLVALGVVVVLGLGPALGYARQIKDEVRVVSADGSRAAVLAPDGLRFVADGATRFKLEIGESWGAMSMLSTDENVTWTVASTADGTSMKIFSQEAKLRLELAEKLLDSGSGVRLYDDAGYPRATFFTGRREGESGLELTDADRQPRIDIYARDNGVSVIRASDSDASALAELSVLPESDAMYRYSGLVPEPKEQEAHVPMLYIEEGAGQLLMTPTTLE